MIGGGGFLGRHLTDKLLERGYRVAVFDIRETFENERIKFHVGDLCNKQVSINILCSCLIQSILHFHLHISFIIAVQRY